MQQLPRDWIEQHRPSGQLKFGTTVIRVTLDVAETLAERMAICRIDGNLSEEEADRITLEQYQKSCR